MKIGNRTIEPMEYRDEPCAFCGRGDVKVCNGPIVSICGECAELSVEVLAPASPPYAPTVADMEDGLREASQIAFSAPASPVVGDDAATVERAWYIKRHTPYADGIWGHIWATEADAKKWRSWVNDANWSEPQPFSAASPIARTDERDLTQCEHCSKEFDITQMTMMEDCWFCEKCVAEFRAAFDACDHDWSPHTNVMGEPGKICSKCTGFVCDDAIAAARTEERG